MTSKLPRDLDWQSVELEEAINWNRVDPYELEVWNRLVGNFWTPERIPLANDLQSWSTFTPLEKQMTSHVFAGLTLLDTIQGRVGALSLIPDAKTPHEEAIYLQIAHMECFTGSHRLLTPKGWKPVAEITTDDLVAQYTEDGRIEFVHPVEVSSHVADSTFRIRSGNGVLDQHVSPGHRVLVERRRKVDGEHRWIPETVEARNLSQGLNQVRFPMAAMPADEAGELTPLEQFFIALQADGSFSKELNSKGEFKRSGVKTGTTPVEFCLAKERKIERLTSILEQLNFKWSTSTDKQDRTRFTVHLPVEFAADRAKKLTDWFSLDEFDAARAAAFIAEAALWDGSLVSSETEDRVMYYCNDVDNVDFLRAMAAIAGYRTSTGSSTKTVGDRDFVGYSLCMVRNKRHVSGQRVTVEEVASERVYGVEVPSTYLLTENNGSVSVTGNCIHAKSYSSIFSTLLSTREIDEEFAWSRDNEFLKKKAAIILHYYKGEDPEKRKIASTMLESFLFYSGFFMPFYWSSHSKLTNTADVIGLIVRDEALHGVFIGSRFQVTYRESSPDRQAELKQFTTDLFEALYENELHYTESIYDNLPSGVTEQVKTFLQYNANRAFQNLGFDDYFENVDVSSIAHILGSISQNAETHDFFSGVGSSYVIGGTRKQESTDEDWDF